MLAWFQKLVKSRGSLSTREPEAKVSSSSTTPVSSSPSPALSSPQRWSRKYDVLVCHSLEPGDTEQAIRLVAFLEDSPRSLRCFLLHRDICPGGAFSTELCQAVQNSHIKALLFTPNFLQDDWCMYVMHQALAEGPRSSRMIPLLHNLEHSEYPKELQFYIYIDLSKDPDQGYIQVNRTVLKYLRDMAYDDEALGCNMDSSMDRLSGVDSS